MSFFSKKNTKDELKTLPAMPSAEEMNKRKTRRLSEVQARIGAIEPMAKRMLGEEVAYIGREELRPCYMLADLKEEEAGLAFDLREYAVTKPNG